MRKYSETLDEICYRNINYGLLLKQIHLPKPMLFSKEMKHRHKGQMRVAQGMTWEKRTAEKTPLK